MTRRTREELAAEVATLEAALGEATARLREAEERAAALAEEKAEVEGRANLARRAVTDFEARIAEQREALAAADEFEEALAAFDAAVQMRDAAGRSLAVAAHELLQRLDEVTTARSEVAAAHGALRRRFGSSAADIPREPPEPPELVDAWTTLRERLQSEIEKNLDEELLEAAASSPFPRAVDKLPPHLQEAGRRRWLERRRQSQRR